MNAEKQAVFDAAVALTGMRNLASLTKQYVEFVTSELHASNWFENDVGHAILCPTLRDTETGAMTATVSLRHITWVYSKSATGNTKHTVCMGLSSYLDSKAKAKALLVGNTLTVTLPYGTQSVLVEGVKRVDVSDTGYNSWMEANFPGVISQEVAARVLESVNDGTSATHKRNAKMSYLRMLEGGVLLRMPE